MFIVGKYLLGQGKLAQDTLVTTVMSNLGFHLALEEAGINSVITAVGDRYVVEEMKKNNYNFGGEQSGHMIFLDYNTTGDGQLSAIQLLKVMRETGKSLSELASEVTIYPQKLVNVRVKDNAAKKISNGCASDSKSNFRNGNFNEWERSYFSSPFRN